MHGLKEQTRGVVFIVEQGDILRFASKYKEKYDGTIHLAEPGTCFSIYMPADYMAHSIRIITSGNITLYTLDVPDSIITKASRFNDRDREDLQRCTDVNTDDLLARLYRCEKVRDGWRSYAGQKMHHGLCHFGIADYSLKPEHMKNVKAAMTEIFEISQDDLYDL